MKKIFLIISMICTIMFGISEIKVEATNGLTPIENQTAGWLSLNKNDLTLGVGYNYRLTATITNNVNAGTILWSSSDKNVATVNNGLVTAVSNGVTVITAYVGTEKATCRVTVNNNYIPLTNIEFIETNITMLINTSKSLEIKVSPSNATNPYIVWSTQNTDILTLNNNVVIANKLGKATIIAMSNGKRTACNITVVDTIPLKEITLNKSTIEIDEKSSTTLNLTYNPTDATNKSVTWKSSNTSIATVDSNGKINGISPGEATITVVSNDSGHVATCKVTVKSISKEVKSITLSKKELSIELGKDETLSVEFEPTYAENKKVTWKSSDTSIATVEDGKITSKKVGTADITATSEDGKKEVTCKVTVTPPPLEKIEFANEKQTIYLSSETKLKTKLTPTEAILENVTWASSDETIATVTDGTVKALKIGTVTVTVSNKDEKIKASIELNIIEKPADPLSIKIEGYNLNFNPKTLEYTLQIKNEKSLKITTNYDEENIVITGNENLENGSIITIKAKDKTTTTKYIINITKKTNYTIYFIGLISLLLIINIIRMISKNKKKK